MSQNFSKMSDIYIPELMELDSYWQKAVEDAICDTLKGEKRLYYALRNRKKIKEKLEMLGLKTAQTQLSFSTLPRSQIMESPDRETSESSSQRSRSPEGASRNMKLGENTSPGKKGDHPLDKRPKTPEKSVLGNGSLEKMKKSQNSFNCEPMGLDHGNEEASDSDSTYEEMDVEDMPSERSKQIEWLHVRQDSDFEFSDTESGNNLREDEAVENSSEFQKHATVRDKNYFINQNLPFGLPQTERHGRKRKNGQEDADAESHTAGRASDMEKRLFLALAKRDILNDNLKATSIGNSSMEVEVHGSALKVAESRRRGKNLLSPFIRFYLEVYRELCQKRSVNEIAQEAAKRWWSLTPKEKSVYSNLKTRQ